MGEKRMQVPLGSQMCWAASQGIGKAWSSLSMSLLSEVEEFTTVGEEERITWLPMEGE